MAVVGEQCNNAETKIKIMLNEELLMQFAEKAACALVERDIKEMSVDEIKEIIIDAFDEDLQ